MGRPARVVAEEEPHMKDTGGPAFPAQHFDLAEHEHGMTLRDWFAGMAMQGMLANDIECGPEQVPIIVASAYVLADAMIQERSKT
jgi:hypothetical protein